MTYGGVLDLICRDDNRRKHADLGALILKQQIIGNDTDLSLALNANILEGSVNTIAKEEVVLA